MNHEPDIMLNSSANRWRKRPPYQVNINSGGGAGGGIGSGRSPGTAVADRRFVVSDPAAATHASTVGGTVASSWASSSSASSASLPSSILTPGDSRMVTDVNNDAFYSGGGGGDGGGAGYRHPQQQQQRHQLHQFYYPASVTTEAGSGGGYHQNQHPAEDHRNYNLPGAARPSPRIINAGWAVERAACLLSPPHVTGAPTAAHGPSSSSTLQEIHLAQVTQGQNPYLLPPPPAQPSQTQGGGRRRQSRAGQGTAATPPTSATQQFDTQQQQRQQQQPQQPQPQQQQPNSSCGGSGGSGSDSRAGVGTIATLILASLLTYALYHASIEALAGQRTKLTLPPSLGASPGGDIFGISEHVSASAVATAAAGNAALRERDYLVDSGIGLKIEEPYEYVPAAASWGGAGRDEADGEGFRDSGGGVAGWGKGVSVVTVSAWQSLAALGAGFLVSRFWRRFRRPDGRALSDAERTRRNRCLLVFAAAHLTGTALEYHGYGVIGATGAEVLRSTEAAFFCLLSLNVGMQRPGLASIPTLLLALGLALAATPTVGNLRAGWGGLRASLAANMLLSVRAIAAKMALDDYGLDEIAALFSAAKMTAGLQGIILLAVEVPRAALGLGPRLLPHLWGVGVMEVDHPRGADVSGGSGGDGVMGVGVRDAGDWGEGRARARLACLLLANGLFLYGHVLVLFALLSRLSATMFAISSGFVRASLVFVLLLALQGSADGPRSVGMALATIAVSAHFYRAYVRGRATSSLVNSVDNTGSLRCDVGVGGDGGVVRGDGTKMPPYPLPHHRRLHLFLSSENDERNSSSSLLSSGSFSGSTAMCATGDGGGTRGGRDAISPPGAASQSGGIKGKGVSGESGPGLFIPLLGTKLGEQSRGLDEVHGTWGRSNSNETVNETVNDDEDESDTAPRVAGDGTPKLSPSRFAWRWMGLKPADTPPPTTAPPHVPLALSSKGRLDQQQQQQHYEAGADGSSGAGGNLALPRFAASPRQPHLSSSPAFGVTASVSAASSCIRYCHGDDGGAPEDFNRNRANYNFPSGAFGEGGGGRVEVAGTRSGGSLPRPAPPFSLSNVSNDGITSGETSGGSEAQLRVTSRRLLSTSVASQPSTYQVADTGTKTASGKAAVGRNGPSFESTETAVAAAAAARQWVVPLKRSASSHGRRGEVDMAPSVSRPRRPGGGSVFPVEEGFAAGFHGAALTYPEADEGGSGIATRDAREAWGGSHRQTSGTAVGTGTFVASPTTSSSSFSLNGFEVIDKDEDMWN